MIDPVPAGATATAPSHLQLVASASSTSDDAKGAMPDTAGASPAGAQAVTRVHVEQSEGGAYVYRLVEATTGQVLTELPRTARNLLNLLHDAPGAQGLASV